MKNILIIYPHWPPSNLAGVHRARLIANYLSDFEWHPIVLTVEYPFYEEALDWDILKTVSPAIEVHYTKALKIGKPRIIGDIGIRAYKQLKIRALELIKDKNIDFIWIPIPSFYMAILGRQLYEKTNIPYGIDYIDPWVRDISNRKNWRSIGSLFLAKLLEPYAVKKAALISGVSKEYYLPVLERNFKHKKPIDVAMPYGFDPNDHKIVLNNLTYPWDTIKNVEAIVYAGAFLPNSAYFLKLLFTHIAKLIKNKKWNINTHLFFLGTGNYQHKSISEFAEEFEISEYIHEIRERFAFLNILNFLSEAKGVLVLGSTEKHYTASKIYQSILSKRPVFAVFHTDSSACQVMQECNADDYLCEYSETSNESELSTQIETKWLAFLLEENNWMPNYNALDKYSAKQSAKVLVDGMEQALYDL
ncbi:MAG: hypothetical protein KAI79_14705 [Bacteroidales bacterium]|nr:hypothetical protein [Bacteroidales bacterium]